MEKTNQVEVIKELRDRVGDLCYITYVCILILFVIKTEEKRRVDPRVLQMFVIKCFLLMERNYF